MLTVFLQVHENEVMRAYKTVNDSYIEPVSFTVPRRAETFQSDIFPPAVGLKPAVSAAEWLSGKTGLPSKIDLESVYDGTVPVEVPSEYKPTPTATSSAPAPAAAAAAPAAKAAPPKEPEPKPKPTATHSGPPPSMGDQKQSIASMASKYQDDEEDDEDDAETSSFEEVGRPQPRQAGGNPQPPASPYKPPQAQSPPVVVAKAATSPVVPRSATFAAHEAPAAPAPAGVTDALVELTQLVKEQNSKIDVLTTEVDGLKKRLLVSTDQSERIRQLELELEEARS